MKAQIAPALTAEEAAHALGVTLPEIRALVRDGLLVRGSAAYGGGFTPHAVEVYRRWRDEQADR